MYFASRLQAGRMLAAQLMPKYRYENCAVVALSDGGVMVGAQIAMQLHCVLTMLLSEEINLPREPQAIGGISQDGAFSYNQFYSQGEIDELVSEYYSYIEQEKMSHMQDMQQLVGSGGLIRKNLLKGRNIILVSDGLPSGFMLDVAVQYLKPIAVEKIIVATPMASVEAVDHMHVLADEIYCLSVIHDYISTEHYYDQQDIPDKKTIVTTLEEIILHWK